MTKSWSRGQGHHRARPLITAKGFQDNSQCIQSTLKNKVQVPLKLSAVSKAKSAEANLFSCTLCKSSYYIKSADISIF